MPSVGVSSHSRYRSYLTTHRGILYFRILVLNHLQSQIGKREIRRSLNGLDSRTARTKALRLSLAAQHFFALADDLAHERIHSAQEKCSIIWYYKRKYQIRGYISIRFHTGKRPVSRFFDPPAPLFFEGAGGNYLLYKNFF